MTADRAANYDVFGGVDQYGIPQRVMSTRDEELMGLLGRTAALASILEMKVAAIASNLEDHPPDEYFAASRAANERTIRRRLQLFTESHDIARVEGILACLPVAASALNQRNQLLHRVWTYAADGIAGVWYGYKSARSDAGDASARFDGRVFTAEDFSPVFAALVSAIDLTSDMVALSGSFPRRGA